MKLNMPIALKILVTISLTACSSNPLRLTDEGREVKVISSRKVPSNCEVVGKANGSSDMGSREIATNMSRNKAGELSATHIFIKDSFSNGKIFKVIADAYECN